MAQIIPAILSDDIEIFRQRLRAAVGFADRIQIDVVDGKFAPFSGVLCLKCVRKYAKTHFLEAHIMIENPASKMEFYQNLGFKKIIPHYGALKDANKYLANHSRISIALNPDEPLSLVQPYLENIETILLMGVAPGQMGQKFIPQTLDKIRQLRQIGDKIEIEVDGGVNGSNVFKIVQAGADAAVCGSAVFGPGNPQENYQRLISHIK